MKMKALNLGRGYRLVWQERPSNKTVRAVVKHGEKIVIRGPEVPEGRADSSIGYIVEALRKLLKEKGETLAEDDPDARWLNDKGDCYWCGRAFGPLNLGDVTDPAWAAVLEHGMKEHPLFYRIWYLREVLPAGQPFPKELIPSGLPAPMAIYSGPTLADSDD